MRKTLTLILVQVVGSMRAFYSAIPVDVVVLCEFSLSRCVGCVKVRITSNY